MQVKKTIFIIPGYRHKTSNKSYKILIMLLKKAGFFPVPISLSWEKQTVSENTRSFLREYRKVRRKEKYILGFSFGAMVAFLASTKVKSYGIILCSLSPYFREDMIRLKQTKRVENNEKQQKDFTTLHATKLAKKVKAKKVLMLYGAKEAKTLISRVTKTYAGIPAKKKVLIPIYATDHNIGDRRYANTIYQVAKLL